MNPKELPIKPNKPTPHQLFHQAGGDKEAYTKLLLEHGYVRPVSPLKFNELRHANVHRCENWFHALKDWSPTDWGCALAGETGELCNLVKKLKRGDVITNKALADELADVIIYADLLAAALEIDLGQAVADKFNEVSARIGSTIKL